MEKEIKGWYLKETYTVPVLWYSIIKTKDFNIDWQELFKEWDKSFQVLEED